MNTKQPGSTAKLIKSILADPQIALYVQHYTIDGSRGSWGLEHVEYKASDMAQLELAVRDSEYLTVYEKEEWITNIKMGDEDILIVLALTLFPNLTSIDFQVSHEFTLSLSRTMHRIADAKYPGAPLAKLISVTIGPGDDKLVGLAPVEAFAVLPSVKIINAERIWDPCYHLDLNVPMKTSKVTDLNVSYGDLSPQRLMLLLQSFEWLQSFTYWPEHADPEHDFNAFLIVTSLLACARDSLRELHIRAESASKEYMGSLRTFRGLEYLETDTVLLFGDSNPLTQNFQTSLPASIREVKLHGSHPNSHAFRLVLTSLIESRVILPNLRSVVIYEMRMSGDEVATLQDMCAMVNISLTFVDTSEDREPESLPTFTRHRGHYAERQAKKALTQP